MLQNPMEPTIHSPTIMVVFILGIVLNAFFLYIRTIIIDDCNPKVQLTLIQKCVGCIAAGSASGLLALGLHINTTIPGGRPFGTEVEQEYQLRYTEFSWKTTEQGIIGHTCVIVTGKQPVTKGLLKEVDVIETRRFIEAFGRRNVNDIIPWPLPKLKNGNGGSLAWYDIRRWR